MNFKSVNIKVSSLLTLIQALRHPGGSMTTSTNGSSTTLFGRCPPSTPSSSYPQYGSSASHNSTSLNFSARFNKSWSFVILCLLYMIKCFAVKIWNLTQPRWMRFYLVVQKIRFFSKEWQNRILPLLEGATPSQHGRSWMWIDRPVLSWLIVCFTCRLTYLSNLVFPIFLAMYVCLFIYFFD